MLLPLFLIAAFLIIAPVAAQPLAPPQTASSLTLEEAVRLAVQRNRRLAAARRDVKAGASGVRSASALSNPNLIFAPSLSGGGGGSDTELIVSQPLEINGTRTARRGVASARQRQIINEGRVLLNDIVFNVQTAYLELVRGREQVALSRDAVTLAQQLDRLTQRQVELGSRPAIEATQTRIELTRAREQEAIAEAAVQVREAALNVLLDHPASDSIGAVALPNQDKLPPLPSLTDSEALALARRPEIPAAQAGADIFRQEGRLARAEGVPDLAPQFRADSVTRGVQNAGFGVGISLPFIDYGSRKNRLRQTEESARAEAERVAAIQAEIRAEVAEAVAQSVAAAAIRILARDVRDDSRHLLNASRIGYEEGKTSLLAVLDAQRTYRATETDYLNAQTNDALSRARWERATAAALAEFSAAATAPKGTNRP